MLARHTRYAHIAALRFDAVLPELLGMKKVVSDDAIRRAFKASDEAEGAAWLRGHLAFCVEPLLAECWILDVDTTIKPLYGHQEGATLGYNPKKPGRSSHCYHTFSMASTRLVLDVDVSPGDEHTSKRRAPSVWALLDRLPRDLWPTLLRGDSGFGNEGIMREAEARGLPYLFKLRLTKNVKRMIVKLSERDWIDADHGRIETRSAVVSYDVGWLQDIHHWPGLKAIGVVRRTRQPKRANAGPSTTETAYYLLSEPIAPERLNQTARDHWGVENRLHGAPDVDMNEDRARNRCDNGPRNLAILKHMTINALNAEPSKLPLRRKMKKADRSDAFLRALLVPI